MKPNKFLFVLLTFIIYNLTFNIAYSTVRYVNKTGSSTPPYTSWETAADSIQKCINICVTGDTVIVANGVYVEKITVNQFIWLIGMSMDSTIIDGSNATPLGVVNFSDGVVMENFTIDGNGTSAPTGIYAFNANFILRNCKMTNIPRGVVTGNLSCLIENCIIANFREAGIDDACFPDTCHSVYRNNIMIPVDEFNSAYAAAFFAAGGYPVFINNIILGEDNVANGFIVDAGIHRGTIKNNLISGLNREGITIQGGLNDTVFIINNSVVYNPMHPNFSYGAITTGFGSRTQIKNNIIANNLRGIAAYNDSVKTDYNLLWNNDSNTLLNVFLGEHTLEADPMFLIDTIPSSEMNFDFHLQAYSPAIDAGDKNIEDADGTRSDIGMFGGPGGESYNYLDLPPRTPRNFKDSLDLPNGILFLNWDLYTENDFSNYNIYRDTIAGFIPNEFNLTAQTDTSYFAESLSPITSENIYYRITSVDNQDNESEPGNEIAVTITGVEPGVEIIRDYILYQNYPNPFNPSTIISYEIKERAYVKLMVYDIKGELVSVLVNKELTAGYYEVVFNSQVSSLQPALPSGRSSISKDLASGIYLYRIEVIGQGRIPVYSDMKKMILLK